MSQKSGEGHSILIAMIVLFILMLGSHYVSEKFGNLQILGIVGESAMEGKEMRFGIASTSLFSVVTTAASCGAVNAMHDSLTPICRYGYYGADDAWRDCHRRRRCRFLWHDGVCHLKCVYSRFNDRRTPEHMGKKIEAKEMTYTVIAVLLPGLCILLFTGLSLLIPNAISSISNPGPHGLSNSLCL